MLSRTSNVFLLIVGALLAWCVLCVAPAPWRTVGSAAADPPPYPTAYADLMSSVQVSVAGDALDLGLFLRIDEKDLKVGTFNGKMGANDKWCVTIEVVQVEPVSSDQFDFNAEGCDARVVLCRITGVAGSVDLIGMAMRPLDCDSTQIYPLARADQVANGSPTLTDKMRETTRHRTSTPASVLDHTYDLARDPSAACGSLPEAERCICVAQKKFEECQASAVKNSAICCGVAVAIALAGLALCGGPAVVIPVLGGISCGIVVASVLAAELLACTAILYNQIDNCMNNFLLDMEGCGWHWAWT